LNGLVNQTDNNGSGDHYVANATAMVWSLGPDGKVDTGESAQTDENKDNVTSW
jgi:hypothetical protein